MSIEIAGLRLITRLKKVVKDHEGLHAVFTGDAQTARRHFSDEDKATFAMIAAALQLLEPPNTDEEQRADSDRTKKRRAEDDDFRSDKPANKKPKPAAANRNYYACLENVTTLRVPPVIESAMRKFASDPEGFLDTNRNIRTNVGGIQAAQVWGDRIEATLRQIDTNVLGHLKWMFHMLSYYDLAQIENPGRSARIGPVMLERIKKLAKNEAFQSLPFAKMSGWSAIGAKLNVLCERFGNGCLFYLAAHMSEYFIENRFDAKHTDNREKALRHLESLGLRDLASDSSANDFGHKIRLYLKEPFLTLRFPSVMTEAGPRSRTASPVG